MGECKSKEEAFDENWSLLVLISTYLYERQNKNEKMKKVASIDIPHQNN